MRWQGCLPDELIRRAPTAEVREVGGMRLTLTLLDGRNRDGPYFRPLPADQWRHGSIRTHLLHLRSRWLRWRLVLESLQLLLLKGDLHRSRLLREAAHRNREVGYLEDGL